MIHVWQRTDEMGFMVSGQVLEHIMDWEYSQDEEVFREQVTTGAYQGRPVDDEMLLFMRLVQSEGRIYPYYGVGGSRGCASYIFQLADSQCTLCVEHGATKQILSIQEPYTLIATSNPVNTPFLKEWNEAQDPRLICRVAEQEFLNLLQWKHWIAEYGLTRRYSYDFGRVSMGKGFAIYVVDTETGIRENITDYDSW